MYLRLSGLRLHLSLLKLKLIYSPVFCSIITVIWQKLLSGSIPNQEKDTKSLEVNNFSSIIIIHEVEIVYNIIKLMYLFIFYSPVN